MDAMARRNASFRLMTSSLVSSLRRVSLSLDL